MSTLCKKFVFLSALLVAGVLSADNFNNLFRIGAPNGDCQICLPGQTAFVPVLKGKAYPYGSIVKTGENSDVVMLLSESDAIRLLADSSVQADLNKEVQGGRIVSLKQGQILVRLNAANTNSTVIIDTPIGKCVSMVGNTKLKLTSTPAETELEIRAETSSQVKFVGPQFVIPSLKNGHGISITTLADNSMTRIRDLLGDYKIFVNKSLELNPDVSASEGNGILLPVAMSSQSGVKIWRENAPVGGRLIVSVLATGPDGKGRESYAFAVGRDNVVTRSNVFDLPELAGDADAAATEPVADDAGLFTEPAVEATDEAAPVTEEAAPAVETDAMDDFLF